MVNGIELTNSAGEVLLISFANLLCVKKMKTQGTANFEEKDLGKDALFLTFAHSDRTLWVTDPGEMEKLWGAYRRWVEGS